MSKQFASRAEKCDKLRVSTFRFSTLLPHYTTLSYHLLEAVSYPSVFSHYPLLRNIGQHSSRMFSFPSLLHGSANFLLSLARLSSNVLHSTSTAYPAARLSSQDLGSLRQRSHPMNPSCRKIPHHHQRDTIRLRHKCAFVNCKLYKGVICACDLTDCSMTACKIPSDDVKEVASGRSEASWMLEGLARGDRR
jgi:hypothetical protein